MKALLAQDLTALVAQACEFVVALVARVLMEQVHQGTHSHNHCCSTIHVPSNQCPEQNIIKVCNAIMIERQFQDINTSKTYLKTW